VFNGAVLGDDHPRRRPGSRRLVLLGAWPTVAAEFHVQVQGDRRRGTATLVVARMSQRVSARRRSTAVSSAIGFYRSYRSGRAIGPAYVCACRCVMSGL